MGKINIKCPKCGKILVLDDSPNVNNKIFKCPVCSVRSRVSDCVRVVKKPVIQSEKTQYGPLPNVNGGEKTQIQSEVQSGGADKTQIIGETTVPTPIIGYLVDSVGKKYQLSKGINQVGRQSANSTANVQIETSDMTMSRYNSIVDVRVSNGTAIHILKNDQNKNPSYLNDAKIGATDQMILSDGDRIKMGKSELTFKL